MFPDLLSCTVSFDTPHTPSRLPLVSPPNLLITIFVRSLGRSDRGRHPITKPSHLDAVARGGAYVAQEKLSTSKVDQVWAAVWRPQLFGTVRQRGICGSHRVQLQLQLPLRAGLE